MATKKIALDAGHGLYTAGKQTPDGIKEWTLNDKVRDKIVANLKDYDCTFIHVDNNEGKKDESLSARVKKYMDAKANVFVSIHHNAYTGKFTKVTGLEVYTDNNPTAKDVELAGLIYNRMVKYIGLKGRGVKRADFTVIDQDKIPAVLCEGGFMDGTDDYKVITSSKGQDAYARAVAEALIEFLDLKKKPTTTTTKPAETKKEDTPFVVKVDIRNLNIRKGPGTNYATTGSYTGIGAFTIVETKAGAGSKAGWGKLKSGAGWISLDFAKKI